MGLFIGEKNKNTVKHCTIYGMIEVRCQTLYKVCKTWITDIEKGESILKNFMKRRKVIVRGLVRYSSVQKITELYNISTGVIIFERNRTKTGGGIQCSGRFVIC